jgi:hypothetical protein
VPTVAIVDGVKIQFFAQEHPPPHFHCAYAEHRAQIEIGSLKVMNGALPRTKLAAVISWASSRQDVLHTTWLAVLSQQKPEKIA